VGENIQNVAIENLAVIQNGTPDRLGAGGIRLREVSNLVISNLKITDVTQEALQIYRGSNFAVSSCFFEDVWTAIALMGGNNGLVTSNSIYNTGGMEFFRSQAA